jgi:single-strand DNA-binding protein
VAATNINRVVLTGNLTADPELRSLPSGNSVCSLRVACNTRRKNAGTGEWEDKPNYFNITVWGAQGENAARFLSKGRPVAIDGRLEWR